MKLRLAKRDPPRLEDDVFAQVHIHDRFQSVADNYLSKEQDVERAGEECLEPDETHSVALTQAQNN
jgi:hypothetical protein